MCPSARESRLCSRIIRLCVTARPARRRRRRPRLATPEQTRLLAAALQPWSCSRSSPSPVHAAQQTHSRRYLARRGCSRAARHTAGKSCHHLRVCQGPGTRSGLRGRFRADPGRSRVRSGPNAGFSCHGRVPEKGQQGLAQAIHTPHAGLAQGITKMRECCQSRSDQG